MHFLDTSLTLSTYLQKTLTKITTFHSCALSHQRFWAVRPASITNGHNYKYWKDQELTGARARARLTIPTSMTASLSTSIKIQVYSLFSSNASFVYSRLLRPSESNLVGALCSRFILRREEKIWFIITEVLKLHYRKSRNRSATFLCFIFLLYISLWWV